MEPLSDMYRVPVSPLSLIHPKSTQLLIVIVCFSFVVYAAPDGVPKLKLEKKDVVTCSKATEDREVAALMLTCPCL